MMNNFIILFCIIFIAVFFYIIIPTVEALRTRDKWKEFRLGLIRASLFPILGESVQNAESPDVFRFFGKIEALQGSDRIWVSDGRLTVAVDLNDVNIFILPAFSFSGKEHNFEHYETVYRHIQPGIVKWRQLFSITEGTQIFVAGEVTRAAGKRVFKNTLEEKLIVVINDGAPSTLLNRAIWCGRQKNEYWNQSTLVSLSSGVLALLTFSYFLFRSQLFRPEGITALVLALLPVAIFLPPGVVFFYFYRKLWKRARFFRANRDLVWIPLRYFDETLPRNPLPGKYITPLPDNSTYVLNVDKAEVNMALVRDPENLTIRGIYGNREGIISGETFLFGKYKEKEQSFEVVSSTDPMIEVLMVSGNPRSMMNSCNQKSTKNAIFAGLLLGLDVIVTFIILFLLLRFILT